MARFSVGGDDDGGDDRGASSRSRRPLPKRPRTTQEGPTLTRNVAVSTSTAAALRRSADDPTSGEEVESGGDESQRESDNSSSHYTTSDWGQESEPGQSPNPRYSSPLLEEEDEVLPAEAGGNENNSAQTTGSGVTLADTDVLDCPICLDPLSIPVYQCESGHLACGSCCNKIRNKCPSCIMPIGYNRCRGMEKVLESAKTSCQNRNYGCVQKISYCKKLDHEKSCKYAPCSCPNDGCNFVGMSNWLYRHFFARHLSAKFSFNTVKFVELLKHDTHIVLQERDERIVFVLNHVIEPLGSLINVICVAPTSSNMKFSYDLTASLDDNLIKLESSVVLAPKLIAQSPMKKFLLVTSDFFDRRGILRLQLIIKRLN